MAPFRANVDGFATQTPARQLENSNPTEAELDRKGRQALPAPGFGDHEAFWPSVSSLQLNSRTLFLQLLFF